MDDETRKKLIEKVKKLLALSGGSPSEVEAVAAAEKAQAMLAEANLTMDDVEDPAGPEMILDGEILTDSRPWRRPLALAVARLYFCSCMYVFEHRKHLTGRARCDRHFFAGEPHNVAVAKLMFRYLCRTIERLAREGSKTVETRRGAYMQSFKAACVQRLCWRIAGRIVDAREGGKILTDRGRTLPALASAYELALAKTSKFLQEQCKGGLQRQVVQHTMNDSRGAIDGAAAGDEIGLDTQIGKSSNATLPKR